MKSMPASSAKRASRRQSGQLADQRSGTLVAERPDEQFAPKTPIFRGLALYMAMRSCIDAVRANKRFSFNSRNERKHHGRYGPSSLSAASTNEPSTASSRLT